MLGSYGISLFKQNKIISLISSTTTTIGLVLYFSQSCDKYCRKLKNNKLAVLLWEYSVTSVLAERSDYFRVSRHGHTFGIACIAFAVIPALGTEPRALCTTAKCSITELYPQLNFLVWMASKFSPFFSTFRIFWHLFINHPITKYAAYIPVNCDYWPKLNSCS